MWETEGSHTSLEISIWLFNSHQREEPEPYEEWEDHDLQDQVAAEHLGLKKSFFINCPKFKDKVLDW